MFYHLKGSLAFCEPGTAVIDCGGVGYKLTVSDNTYQKLADKRDFSPDGTASEPEVKLFTHMSVREDAVELFGFIDQNELSSFRLLISVSGIGPKAAMAILSIMTPQKLAIAVASEDVKAISRAPGVGTKTAARVVLELKDKLSLGETTDNGLSAIGAKAGSVPAAGRGKLSEAVDALMVLGYSRAEAQTALRDASPELSLEDLIKFALTKLMKQ